MPRGQPTPHQDEMTSLLCNLPGLSLANCVASLDFHVILLAAAAAEVAVCWRVLPNQPRVTAAHTYAAAGAKLLTFTFKGMDLCGRTHPISWCTVFQGVNACNSVMDSRVNK